MNWSETLRSAIIASGKTQVELSQAAKVPQPTISDFLRGGSLRLETAEKIAAVVGVLLKSKFNKSKMKAKP